MRHSKAVMINEANLTSFLVQYADYLPMGGKMNNENVVPNYLSDIKIRI